MGTSEIKKVAFIAVIAVGALAIINRLATTNGVRKFVENRTA